MEQLITTLQSRLSAPLPGETAQWKMAHAVRNKFPQAEEAAKIACVLVTLYPRNDEWHLVFIQRVGTNPRDRHGGQISFPGGRYEESDASFEQGAIREAEEEVGIIGQDVVPLGRLTKLFIPVSNFIVHPVVGYLNYTPVFIPQASEVQKILEVPLAALKNPANRRRKEIELSNNLVLKNVPYFDLRGHVIWGATAMILNEFLEIVP